MSFALRRFLRSSLTLWAAVACFGFYFLYNIKQYINFGIDLVGGTYVTLELETDQLLENELLDKLAVVLRKTNAGRSIMIDPRVMAIGDGVIAVTCGTENETKIIESAIQSQSKELHILTTRDGATLKCFFDVQERGRLIKHAVDNNVRVLAIRLDKFGVGEVQVAAHGERQIFVELPQVQDGARAREIIGTSAILEIKPVQDVVASQEDALKRYGGSLPDNVVVVPMERSGSAANQFCIVPKRADITGKNLKAVRANPMGGQLHIEPVVEFSLDAEGAQRFYKMTSTPPATIAIILDGKAVTVASAKHPIPDGSVVLSGGDFTVESVNQLAKLLGSGVFAAPMRPVEDRVIGPSLGAASIRQGLLACLVGLIALLIFSLWFYRLAGLFAFVVLLFNLLLILFALAALPATLTLPGIYGMVLTLGMAVDASVLIYERIREELGKGVSLPAAIDAGFGGALTVILDANITTLLAALVLYYVGTGPIQGFAVTMSIGIISTLVTGLFLLRAIFRFAVDACGLRTLRL